MSRFTRSGRILLAATLSALVLAAPAPAHAHGGLAESSPEEGERLTAGPSSVALLFGDSVLSRGTTVQVTGPDGRDVTAGPPVVTVTLVTTPLEPLTQSGKYTVAYEVVSDDGDTLSDSYSFTLNLVEAAATGSDAGPEQPVAAGSGADSEQPVVAAGVEAPSGVVWVGVVAAVLLAGTFAVVVVVLAGRRRADPASLAEPSR
jgi:methionine-rich copper-binding protein CopC